MVKRKKSAGFWLGLFALIIAIVVLILIIAGDMTGNVVAYKLFAPTNKYVENVSFEIVEEQDNSIIILQFPKKYHNENYRMLNSIYEVIYDPNLIPGTGVATSHTSDLLCYPKYSNKNICGMPTGIDSNRFESFNVSFKNDYYIVDNSNKIVAAGAFSTTYREGHFSSLSIPPISHYLSNY